IYRLPTGAEAKEGRQAGQCEHGGGMMTGCMRAARELIQQVQQEPHTTAVFIAADVPFTARPATPQAGSEQAGAKQGGGKPGGGEPVGGEQGERGEQEVVRSDLWAETTWSFGEGGRVRAAPRDSLWCQDTKDSKT
ncbi:unnamed protein product, partial [Closterium sp. NIES-64]